MQSLLKQKQELLFEEDIELIKIQEYGFSWQEFITLSNIPAGGARFDIHFKGRVVGERIKGTIHGVDYMEVRADGRISLNLHATLYTEDEASIKVTESGINNAGGLSLMMHCYTSDTRYQWLNKLQILCIGNVDFETARVHINAYSL